MTTRKLTTVDAFVVTDLATAEAPAGVPAAGIVRTAPKVLVDGATWLARSQTYQFAAFGRRLGGASAAVNAPVEGRGEALDAFVAEIGPEIVAGRLLLEPAKGIPAPVATALRALDPRPALWWDHRAELRGVGIAAAVAATVPSGGRVTIEGFDDAGPTLVAALAEQGHPVVAVATASGTVVAPGGFDPVVVAEAWAAHGWAFVNELGGGDGADTSSGSPGSFGSPGAVFGVAAEALVVGSKVGVLDHDGAAGLSVGAVVPGGALPVTAKALAVLRRAGVTVLPDFVTTAGALVAWPDDGVATPPDVAAARGLAVEAIRAVLAEVAGHPDGPLLGACERAERFLADWVDDLPFGRPLA